MLDAIRDGQSHQNGSLSLAVMHIKKAQMSDRMIDVHEAIVQTSKSIRLRMQDYLLLVGIRADGVTDCALCLLEMDDDFMSLIGSATEADRTAKNKIILERHQVPELAFIKSRLLIEEAILALAESVGQ
jgi:hypothetical protein